MNDEYKPQVGDLVRKAHWDPDDSPSEVVAVDGEIVKLREVDGGGIWVSVRGRDWVKVDQT
jgi:hypothetical protein